MLSRAVRARIVPGEANRMNPTYWGTNHDSKPPTSPSVKTWPPPYNERHSSRVQQRAEQNMKHLHRPPAQSFSAYPLRRQHLHHPPTPPKNDRHKSSNLQSAGADIVRPVFSQRVSFDCSQDEKPPGGPSPPKKMSDSDEEKFDSADVRPKFIPRGYEKLNKHIYSRAKHSSTS